MKKRKSILGSVCLIVALFSLLVCSDEVWHPKKTVDFIVPFNAGGSSDMLARIFANQGASYFEKDFVILNEGGGSCAIGLADLITRKPDGYAIGICTYYFYILQLSFFTM